MPHFPNDAYIAYIIVLIGNIRAELYLNPFSVIVFSVRLIYLFVDVMSLIDKNGMVFVLNPFAEKITDCTCIIEESVLGGCIFDGKAIYYIDEDGVQKMYNVVNKTFRI